MPSSSTHSAPIPISIAARFKQVYDASMLTISPLLDKDLLAAIVAGNPKQFSHLVRILGKQTGNHDAWALADAIDERVVRWQDWMHLQNAISPPVDARAIPRVLPRGLGGAKSDEQLENVADFYERYVTNGRLPQKARDLIREAIDRNEPRFWIQPADRIASVTYCGDDKRVIILLRCGREDYVDAALDGSADDGCIPDQDEDDFTDYQSD